MTQVDVFVGAELRSGKLGKPGCGQAEAGPFVQVEGGYVWLVDKEGSIEMKYDSRDIGLRQVDLNSTWVVKTNPGFLVSL